MQSSQDLNASVTAGMQETSDKDSVAQEARSSKPTHSEVVGESDESEPIIDILECFPILLSQYVFQHLNAKELLEMSTVNKRWNQFVGEKPQVGKMKLVIDENEDKLTSRTKEILMNSERNYQNIDIVYCAGKEDFLVSFLAKGAGSWKFVHLIIDAPVTQDICLKILRIIEPSVESFEVWLRREETPLSVDLSLNFPRLKHLAGRYRIFKHFVGVTSLCSLKWWQFSPTEENTLDLLTVLRNNHNLREIHARGLANMRVFDQLSEVEFKLQKLSIKLLTEDAVPGLLPLPFLKPQAETLEELDIDMDVDQALLKLILCMPRLTKLKIFAIVGEIQELPVNSTITSFEVFYGFTARDGAKSRRRNAYHTLIRAMRSLERFECFSIDDELLMVLALNVPDLESIEVVFFNVLHVPERNVFPSIKEFKAQEFRQHMREPTADHNFAKLVIREMSASTEREQPDSD